jgi:hypothetical protein
MNILISSENSDGTMSHKAIVNPFIFKIEEDTLTVYYDSRLLSSYSCVLEKGVTVVVSNE